MIKKLDFIKLREDSIGDLPMATMLQIVTENFVKSIINQDLITLQSSLMEVAVDTENNLVKYEFVLPKNSIVAKEVGDSIDELNVVMEELVNERYK